MRIHGQCLYEKEPDRDAFHDDTVTENRNAAIAIPNTPCMPLSLSGTKTPKCIGKKTIDEKQSMHQLNRRACRLRRQLSNRHVNRTHHLDILIVGIDCRILDHHGR